MQVSEIYTTAPVSGCSEIETKTYALLDQLGIPYERVEHAPANTMEDCQDIDLQEPLPLQPPENRVLPAVHAR